MQPLDYIFSRDILNEGVDIVEVNQVIMLRPHSRRLYSFSNWDEGTEKKHRGKNMLLFWILSRIIIIIS